MGPHLLAWELQLELGNNQVWTPALPDFVQWDKQCLWGRHTLMRRIKWVHIFDVNQVFPRTLLQCLSISRTPNQIISITEWANSYIVDSYKAATSLVTNGPTRLFHKNCTVQSDYQPDGGAQGVTTIDSRAERPPSKPPTPFDPLHSYTSSVYRP